MAKFLKKLVAQELRQLAAEAESCILVDFRSLPAKQSNELRNRLRELGVRMNVVPNRLYRRAWAELLGGADASETMAVAQVLRGPTAVVFGDDGAVTAAKVLKGWLKDHKQPEIKGGFLLRRVIDAAGVDELARIPSREELLSQIVGLIVEPLRRIVCTVDSAARNLVYAVNGIVEKKKESEATSS